MSGEPAVYLGLSRIIGTESAASVEVTTKNTCESLSWIKSCITVIGNTGTNVDENLLAIRLLTRTSRRVRLSARLLQYTVTATVLSKRKPSSEHQHWQHT